MQVTEQYPPPKATTYNYLNSYCMYNRGRICNNRAIVVKYFHTVTCQKKEISEQSSFMSACPVIMVAKLHNMNSECIFSFELPSYRVESGKF